MTITQTVEAQVQTHPGLYNQLVPVENSKGYVFAWADYNEPHPFSYRGIRFDTPDDGEKQFYGNGFIGDFAAASAWAAEAHLELWVSSAIDDYCMDAHYSLNRTSGCIEFWPAPVRHGVVIRAHKNWNTKTIFNRDYVMTIYRHCPKTIRFTSPMVNDYNQNLCGGWVLADIGPGKEATIRQMLTGQKPFCCIWYATPEEAQAAATRLLAGGLNVEVQERLWSVGSDRMMYDVLAAQKITLAEIGDLSALRADYGDVCIDIDVERYAHRPLSSFFGGWDVEDVPFWVTGVLLGYPVENTISRYLW